jgi:DNA-binding PadR family transcriptional regulator
MKWISRKEELLLLAVLQLDDNAYGVSIRQFLLDTTMEYWSIGAIHDVLERLKQKGQLSSYISNPLPERGGRSRKYYRITNKGIEALKEVRHLHEIMWSGISGANLKYEQ